MKNNQMMQVAGQSLAKKTESLIKEYHRQSNIQQTIDALSQAFPGRITSNIYIHVQYNLCLYI
jgi:Cdc6-like AAA superfamily ATPase